MRRMEFKMERQGLVKPGDRVKVTEGVLPYSEIQRLMRLYHYTQEATETLNTIKERHRRKKDE